MSQYFWQHRTSGEIYVVQIQPGGGYPNNLVGVTGPVHGREVRRDLLGEFACDDLPEEGWFHPGEYRELEESDIIAIEEQYM
jgi:hypothetical protein